MDVKNKPHQKLAVELFNQTWDLIEKEDWGQVDIDNLINAAHASRYHWGMIGEGINIVRGEWLISCVYALLKRAEACRNHAKRCLEITLDHNIKDYDLAFAYEAMARTADLARDEIATSEYVTLAKDAGAEIEDAEDRAYFFSELNSIQPDA